MIEENNEDNMVAGNIMETSIFKSKWMEFLKKSAVLSVSKRNNTLESIPISTFMLKCVSGGVILPYFQDPATLKWKVILVGQYRLALEKITLEAPGGKIESGKSVEKTMALELEEETGIKIETENIKMVFQEFIQPSIINASIFGAIVRIEESPQKQWGGNYKEGEKTKIICKDLVSLMKMRGKMALSMDLVTSRLLDETAKAVGLIEKKY